MALTKEQQAQIAKQLQEMQQTLAKLSEAAKVFSEAESLGIAYDPKTTQHQDLAKQVTAAKAIQQAETKIPEGTRTQTATTPSEVATSTKLPRTTVKIGGIDFSIPTELVNSPFFQSATDEQKALIAYSWQSVADQGHDLNTMLSALETAAQQSDIYIGQQIRTFEDELAMSMGYIIEDYGVGKELILRQMDNTTADLEAYERLMARRASELEEDLEYYTGTLDIDQTKALQKQLDSYKQNLEYTRETMADRGLFHSSIRGRAEDLLAKANEDITEDIITKTARQKRELEITASRNLEDIEYQKEQQRTQAQRQQQAYQDQLAQLQTQSKRGATDLLRQGEQYLGTEHMKTMLQGKPSPETGLQLPNLGIRLQQQDWMPSDWMVGDIKATGVKAQQQQDILQRAQSFIGT